MYFCEFFFFFFFIGDFKGLQMCIYLNNCILFVYNQNYNILYSWYRLYNNRWRQQYIASLTVVLNATAQTCVAGSPSAQTLTHNNYLCLSFSQGEKWAFIRTGQDVLLCCNTILKWSHDLPSVFIISEKAEDSMASGFLIWYSLFHFIYK